MNTRIVTLTLSPSVDLSTTTPVVRPEHKLRCTPGQLDPGGGGLNVARVVHELGGVTLAVFASGGVTGRLLEERLGARRVPFQAVPCEANTRICFNAGETDTGHEYRFVLPGAQLTAAELSRCVAALDAQLGPADILVVSGSLPPGLPDDTYARIVERARSRGVRVVLDTSGASLKAALGPGILLAKPSRRELSELVGRQLGDLPTLAAACRELQASGAAEILVVSMGGEGAIMTAASGQWRVLPPRVESRSAVGAGDSFVGAMTLSLARGESLETALTWATAAGAAALLTPGTELCTREDVDRLRSGVRFIPVV
jgi:6-phosphofructokinase 2